MAVNMLPLLLFAALAGTAHAWHGCSTPGGKCERDKQVLPLPDTYKEDFQFEIRNIYTDRQRGARLNIFVKFRYYTTEEFPEYTTETGSFDYQDMKKVVLSFVPAGAQNLPRDTYWEIVVRDLAKAVWKEFPIRGLSIRAEVQGMSSGGIPSHRASTVTIGDIEPWVSQVNNFPGCDGMDADNHNKACRIAPTWGEADKPTNTTQDASKAKSGQHDKPAVCDFCG